jgi:RNA polymerase sigma-70 factor, ECF subfamily
MTEVLTYPLIQNAANIEVAANEAFEDADRSSENGTKTDISLAQAAGWGDKMAFEELYNRHHRRVYSLCLRMLQNPVEAEDLTQEVFIQLYRKIGSFRGDSAFTTWLHRMTVNQVLMHFRKRSVKFEKTTEEGDTPEQIVSGTENPSHMRIVDKIALDNAIEQLPPGYRSVFVLHDIEGYEHEEISKLLGCSVGTSKSQLHKARLKLRRLLKKKAAPRLVPVTW